MLPFRGHLCSLGAFEFIGSRSMCDSSTSVEHKKVSGCSSLIPTGFFLHCVIKELLNRNIKKKNNKQQNPKPNNSPPHPTKEKKKKLLKRLPIFLSYGISFFLLNPMEIPNSFLLYCGFSYNRSSTFCSPESPKEWDKNVL